MATADPAYDPTIAGTTPPVVIDGTGLTTTVPLLIKNAKNSSGVELQVTGTAVTGYLIRDSAGTQKTALGYAISNSDWATGSLAGGTVLRAEGHLLLSSGDAANGIKFLASSASVVMNSSVGITLFYSSIGLTITSASSTFTGVAAISNSNSTSNVALQINGDANTGVGQVGGADTISLVAGGTEMRYSAAGIITSTATAPEVDLNSNANSGAPNFQVNNSGNTARGLFGAHGSTATGTTFGINNQTIVRLVSFAGTAPLLLGSTVAADVVFGANDAEVFRLDQANSQIKLPAAGVAANGTGTVTVGNLAPGSTAVAIVEWMNIRTAGGLRRIPLFG